MHDAAAVLSVLGAAGSLDETGQILHLKLLRLWPFSFVNEPNAACLGSSGFVGIFFSHVCFKMKL